VSLGGAGAQIITISVCRFAAASSVMIEANSPIRLHRAQHAQNGFGGAHSCGACFHICPLR
jgi:hypothetical protein